VAEIVVDETGRVSDIKILRSSPQLDAAAIADIKTWMYQPATLAGRPVPVRLVVEVTFQSRLFRRWGRHGRHERRARRREVLLERLLDRRRLTRVHPFEAGGAQ